MLEIKPTWTAERIELLKNRFEAGLSCSQIAQDIGVSRNAVIGKISRLSLSRPKCAGGRYLERRIAPKVERQRVFSTPRIVRGLHAKPQPPAEETPIPDGQRCSLLEAREEQCRWPIGKPGAENFLFCGNKTVEGLSYCAGHARVAYQPEPASRRRRAHLNKKTKIC